jgi:tight adherence protein C
MPLIAALLLFCILTASITFFGYRLYAKPRRLYERLGEDTAPTPAASFEDRPVQSKPIMVRVMQIIGEKVPISPQDASQACRYLVAAGFRSDSAIKVYYGLKIFFAVSFLCAAALLRDAFGGTPMLRTLIVLGAGAVGYVAPTFLLERRIKKRQETLRLSLPDALDLMVVCVEAGLGLDQAIVNVSRELAMTHKDISDELGLVTLEMRAGKRRADALKNLADRTGEKELRKWVATMTQADRFGTSISDSLRTHSEFMRVKRRQNAEERAGKVGVKLVFPIFFFILPSMLVVAAGPGLLQLFKNLFPMMKNI